MRQLHWKKLAREPQRGCFWGGLCYAKRLHGTGAKLSGVSPRASTAGAQSGQKTSMTMLMQVSFGSRWATHRLCCSLSASFALPRLRLLHMLRAAPCFLPVLDQDTQTHLALCESPQSEGRGLSGCTLWRLSLGWCACTGREYFPLFAWFTFPFHDICLSFHALRQSSFAGV